MTHFLVAPNILCPVQQFVNPDLQARIRDLLLAQLDWAGQGRVLDIGCGSAALAIQCELNARLAGVHDRVRFHEASAAALLFPRGVLTCSGGFFGSREEPLAALRALGAGEVRLVRTGDAPFIPALDARGQLW